MSERGTKANQAPDVDPDYVNETKTSDLVKRTRQEAEQVYLDRAYEVYCSIAREVYHREPMPRERWLAIPQRSLFRTTTLPRHDDAEFDNRKDLDGDAQ